MSNQIKRVWFTVATSAMALLALSTCTAQQSTHTLIRSGTTSGLSGKAAQAMVVQDQAAYEELFRKVASVELPNPDPPPVDFRTNVVVFAALGEKPTAGYGIEVVSATCDGAVLRVKLHSIVPASDRAAAQMLTNPYVLTAVQRCAGMRTVEFTGEDFVPPRTIAVDQGTR
jgi:PrcB C-terminal